MSDQPHIERFYQPVCNTCKWVGDPAEYKYQADTDAKEHDCLLETGTIELDYDGTDKQGIWATHRPTLQQFLLVPSEEASDE